MTEFKASNGIEVKNLGGNWDRTAILFTGDSHPSNPRKEREVVFDDEDFLALREYFRDERDRELGRWRDLNHSGYVVYPKVNGSVRVLEEMTGQSQLFTRDSDFDKDWGGSSARAYFDAHPEKKPWHDAEQNDVWALQIKDCYEPELYRFAMDTTCAAGKVFRPVNNPARVFFEANSPLIESAEKVWPQSKES